MTAKPTLPRRTLRIALVRLLTAVAMGIAVRIAWNVHKRVGTAAPRACADLVPPTARGMLIADVARLRQSIALHNLFEQTRAGEPCESTLLRAVSHVAFALGESNGELGLAFDGNLPREALLACARSHGTPDSEIQRDQSQGVDRLRIVPRHGAELLPRTNGSEIAYLPDGTVLAGSADMVERMIERARAPRTTVAFPTAVTELLRRVGPGHDVRGALVLSPTELPTGTEVALAHVAGVGIGVTAGNELEVTVVVACNDYDSPRAVADALERLRQPAMDLVAIGPVQDVLRHATIERRATDVRLHALLSAAALNASSVLLTSLLRSASEPAPDAGIPAP